LLGTDPRHSHAAISNVGFIANVPVCTPNTAGCSASSSSCSDTSDSTVSCDPVDHGIVTVTFNGEFTVPHPGPSLACGVYATVTPPVSAPPGDAPPHNPVSRAPAASNTPSAKTAAIITTLVRQEDSRTA
jgi:hypothetical protein